jgi:hypothetical protein
MQGCGRSNKVSVVHAYAAHPTVTSLEDLPTGEQRMLKVRKLKYFVAELFSPIDFVPRRPREKPPLPKSNAHMAAARQGGRGNLFFTYRCDV